MSGLIKPYISNGITDLNLRQTLDSIIKTIDGMDINISNENPNTSKTRGGRLWYNAATNNLYIFNKGAWDPVSPETFEHVAETFIEVDAWDSSVATSSTDHNQPATPTGGTYTFSSAVAGSVTTQPTGGYKYPNSRTNVLQWIPASSVTGAAGKFLYKCTSIVVSDSTTGVVTPLAWSEPVLQPATTFLGSTKLQRVTVYYWGANTPGNGTDNAATITNCTITGTLNWATGSVSNLLGPDDSNNSGVSGQWSEVVPTRDPENTSQGRQYSAILTFKDETGVAASSDATVGVIYRGTSFTGMVTFDDYSNINGDRFGNLTTIHGGRIETGSITTDQLSTATKGTLNYTTVIASASQSVPTTRNDGKVLQVGDTYHDVTTGYQYMWYGAGAPAQWHRLSIFADSISANFINTVDLNADKITTGTLTITGSGSAGAKLGNAGLVQQLVSGSTTVGGGTSSASFTQGIHSVAPFTARNDANFTTKVHATIVGSFRINSSSVVISVKAGILQNGAELYYTSQVYDIGQGHSYVPIHYTARFTPTKGASYALFINRYDTYNANKAAGARFQGSFIETRVGV